MRSGDSNDPENITNDNIHNFRLTMQHLEEDKDALTELEEKSRHESRYAKMKFQITNFLVRMNKNYMGTTHLYERIWTLPVYFPKGTDLQDILSVKNLFFILKNLSRLFFFSIFSCA